MLRTASELVVFYFGADFSGSGSFAGAFLVFLAFFFFSGVTAGAAVFSSPAFSAGAATGAAASFFWVPPAPAEPPQPLFELFGCAAPPALPEPPQPLEDAMAGAATPTLATNPAKLRPVSIFLTLSLPMVTSFRDHPGFPGQLAASISGVDASASSCGVWIFCLCLTP